MTLPRATARIQLHRDFGFDALAATIPYYAALGISHIYASPILAARQGSTHGYDMVDPTRINPELGGEEGLRRVVERLRAAGMGLILDIVPNHMGIGPDNPWWQHVLEWGRDSPYAHWFDIDWEPPDETLRGKVLAPFLGQPYGDALAAGEIRLCFDADRGRLYIDCPGHRFPLAPPDYAAVLRAADSPLLSAAVAAFERGHGTASAAARQQAALGHGLLYALQRQPQGAQAIEAALAAFAPESAPGFDALHALLERQHYRLAWWRCAADAMNWRRFFEVTDLAGVRVEQDDVFEATHALVFRLVTEGLVDGLRIDHVDGLADPGGYCRKLRARLEALGAQRPPHLAPEPAYLVTEKILAPGEPLRTDWGIDGSSGYDFMDRVGALLHDAAGEAPLTAFWSELSGQERDFSEEVRLARRQLIANNLAGEFEGAARALHALARTDLRSRDYSLGALRRVLAELLVHFPVYRTYVSPGGGGSIDRDIMERALEPARRSVERTEAGLLELVAQWLAGEAPREQAGAGTAGSEMRLRHARAITRFQQLTPPLAAKSSEDTAFYRYGRLLSRNEVGSDPGQFSIPAEEFHRASQERALRFPASMLATATHDHKRGEDTRARLAAISEMPDSWVKAVREWMRLNARDGGPHAADEAMLYQMLAGAWPVGLDADDAEGLRRFAARIARWQTKALREAKQASDWVLPNEDYEAACGRFLESILAPGPDNAFLAHFLAWLPPLVAAGMAKSLAQAVLRMTSPGMPDLYQGCDLWDFSLVDPDNRSPVDYALRQESLEGPLDPKDGAAWRSGRIKQQLVRRTLALRAREPALFAQGAYLPLALEGKMAGHALAFARRHQDRTVIVAAAHLPAALLAAGEIPTIPPAAWKDSFLVLPAASGPVWADIFTGARKEASGGRLALADLLSDLPVAVLAGAEAMERRGAGKPVRQ